MFIVSQLIVIALTMLLSKSLRADYIMPDYTRTKQEISKSPIATGFSKRKSLGLAIESKNNDYSSNMNKSVTGLTYIEKYNVNLEGNYQSGQYNSNYYYFTGSNQEKLKLNESILLSDKLVLGLSQSIDRSKNGNSIFYKSTNFTLGTGYKLTDELTVGTEVNFIKDQSYTDHKIQSYGAGISYSKLKSKADNGFSAEYFLNFYNFNDPTNPYYNNYKSLDLNNYLSFYYQQSRWQTKLSLNYKSQKISTPYAKTSYFSASINPEINYFFKNNFFVGTGFSNFRYKNSTKTYNSVELMGGYQTAAHSFGITLEKNFINSDFSNDDSYSVSLNTNIYQF